MKRIITFGTYDLFHIGHVNIIRRAASLGNWLAVGISTDELNYSKKQKYPVFPYAERSGIVSSLRYVNEVFPEESLELKAEYIKYYRADVLVMGDDWKGKFDHFSDICEVVYFPRTEEISTTELKSKIRSAA